MLFAVHRYLHVLKSGDFCTHPVCYGTQVPLLMSSFAIPSALLNQWLENPEGWERLVREGTYGPNHLHGSKNRGTGPPAFGCGRSTTSVCRKAILSTGNCWRPRVAINRERELKLKQLPKPAQQRKKLDEASSFCCCFFLQLIKNENLTPSHKYTFF